MFTAANLFLMWQLRRVQSLASFNQRFKTRLHQYLYEPDKSIICTGPGGTRSTMIPRDVQVMPGCDERVSFSSEITVHLHDWTAYMNSSVQPTSSGSVYILLESSAPDDEEEFIEEILNIEKAKRVELLSMCEPLAWKPGTPFTIICTCTKEQFVLLCEAFKEDRLIMDELLKINLLANIQVIGSPSQLLTPDSKNFLRRNSSSLANVLLCQNQVSLTSNYFVFDEEIDEGSHQELSDSDTKIPIEVRTSTDNAYSTSEDITVNSCADNLTKSPNILIYTGKRYDSAMFKSLKDDLQTCLGMDSFTIYHLKHSDICSLPWQQNCRLLIIKAEQLYDGSDARFMEYFLTGGRILSLCSSLDGNFIDKCENERCNRISVVEMLMNEPDVKPLSVVQGRFYYTKKSSSSYPDVTFDFIANNSLGQQVLAEVSGAQEGKMILSQVHLEYRADSISINQEIHRQLQTEQYTECRIQLLTRLLKRLGIFPSHSESGNRAEPTKGIFLASSPEIRVRLTDSVIRRHRNKLSGEELNIPNIGTIELGSQESKPDSFNWHVYLQHLNSKHLGNVVIYQKICKSTQLLVEPFLFCLPPGIGLVGTCRQQIAGVGRGGNDWLSPQGSLALSMHVRIDLNSNLGQAPALLQTIPAVAVALIMAEYLDTPTSSQHKPVRVKWPNDIYSDSVKIGGVLVKSTILQSTLHAIIGIGVNVSNDKPTRSLNQVISTWADHQSDRLKMYDVLSIEYMTARICTEVESLIDLVNKDVTEYMNIYYNYWMHSGVRVDVPDENISQALILGLDRHGYLLLAKDDGSTFSAQPDGNSFDIMHNLITLKK